MPFASSATVGDSGFGANPPHSIRKRNQQLAQQQAIAIQRPLRAKVVVLGNTGVGKTSILLRHDGQGFTSKLASTLGASYVSYRSRSKITNGRRDFELQIWDTAGQERFRSMVPLYLRNTSAAIIVFDLANRQSFRDIDSWIKEVQHNDESGQILLFLVGNKCDLGESRAVTQQEGRQFAEQQNAQYFETSALSGKGIEMAMQQIAEDILQTEQRQLKERQELARSSFNLAPSEAGDESAPLDEDEGGGEGRKKGGGNGSGCCSIL